MRSGTLLVEGELDELMMNQIVPLAYLVVRGAGKMDMRARMEGFRSASQNAVVFAFRDRDFDGPMPDSGALEVQGNVLWAARRTIENYLLLPAHLDAYIAARGERMRGMFGGKPAADVIADAALHIRHYQIARAALGEVRRPNALRSTWQADSDQLPADLSQDGCLKAAQAYLDGHLAMAGSICDPGVFRAKFDHYASLYTEQFIAEGRHLVAFSGKNLCKAISIRYPNFPMRTFLQDTASKIQADGFADLRQLVNLLTEKLR